MTARAFDPFRLDVAAFANATGVLDGHWPLERFDRLVEAAMPGATFLDATDVAWSLRGERRLLRGKDVQTRLHLTAATALPLECQRCLKTVVVPLRIDRSFLFVHGEDAAAQLDAESPDDVLALTRALDLRELIEDELILALPLVPRHEVCPQPLQIPAGEDQDEPKPFAALAALKSPKSLN